MAAMVPGRMGLPPSSTVASLPTRASGPSQDPSSDTWTSTSMDMGLLSESDEFDCREVFVEEYNRLAGKHNIRLLVPEDYEACTLAVNPPEKKRWFSRHHGSSNRSVSAKSTKTRCHHPSLSNLPAHLHHHHKGGTVRNHNLQQLVRLCGKSILYLPPDYTPGCLVLPTCLRATAQYLVKHGPQTRGVFRVPGAIRAVNGLFDYYCSEHEGGGTISGTVRAPNLPGHIDFGAHDVASAFKRLLSVLPGGVIGSLSVFDALVAIHSQLNGDPEGNRTGQTKLRSRLIALAVGSVESRFQRDLICAVFGLLCLIGRAAETAPREDGHGRPLPTSDLMGYHALGIIFGPLLIGNLIDHYSMKITTPNSGLVLFPVTPPVSRREKAKSRKRSQSEGPPPTPVPVDKILVANAIAEMLIANWTEVVRNFKSLGIMQRHGHGKQRQRSSTSALRASASESLLGAVGAGPAQSADAETGPSPTGTFQRFRGKAGRSSDQESPAQSLIVTKQRSKAHRGNVFIPKQPDVSHIPAAQVNAVKVHGKEGAPTPEPRLTVSFALASSNNHGPTKPTKTQPDTLPCTLLGNESRPSNMRYPEYSGWSSYNRETSTPADEDAPLVGSTHALAPAGRGASSTRMFSKAHRVLKAKLSSVHLGGRGLGRIPLQACSHAAQHDDPGVPAARWTSRTGSHSTVSTSLCSEGSGSHVQVSSAQNLPASKPRQASAKLAMSDGPRAHDAAPPRAVPSNPERHPKCQPTDYGIFTKSFGQEGRIHHPSSSDSYDDDDDVAALRDRGSPTRPDVTKHGRRRLSSNGVPVQTRGASQGLETRSVGMGEKSAELPTGHASRLAAGKQVPGQGQPDPPPTTKQSNEGRFLLGTPGNSVDATHSVSRSKVSVSGANVKAMAAMFDSVAQVRPHSLRKSEVPTIPKVPLKPAPGGGVAPVLAEYIRNPTPPSRRSARSSKSCKSDDARSLRSSTTPLAVQCRKPTDGSGREIACATTPESTLPDWAASMDGAMSEDSGQSSNGFDLPAVLRISPRVDVSTSPPGCSTVRQKPIVRKESPRAVDDRLGAQPPSLGNFVLRSRESDVAYHMPLARPTLGGQELEQRQQQYRRQEATPWTVEEVSAAGDEECLRQSRTRSRSRSPRSRTQSSGTCLLHAQIRMLQRQLASKTEECRLLRAELAVRHGVAISETSTLSEQLRLARRDSETWRGRAETAERRLGAYEQFTDRVRGLERSSRSFEQQRDDRKSSDPPEAIPHPSRTREGSEGTRSTPLRGGQPRASMVMPGTVTIMKGTHREVFETAVSTARHIKGRGGDGFDTTLRDTLGRMDGVRSWDDGLRLDEGVCVDLTSRDVRRRRSGDSSSIKSTETVLHVHRGSDQIWGSDEV